MKEDKAYIGDEKKQLKNYLHFYLGCGMYNKGLADHLYAKGIPYTPQKLRTVGSDGLFWVGSEEDSREVSTTQFKLILRPLSDMTGKEVLEVFHLSYNESNYKFSEYERVDNNEFGWRARNQNGMECFVPANSFKPEVFLWLLSKGFDLFGLIESGLAIDKTTLNKQS